MATWRLAYERVNTPASRSPSRGTRIAWSYSLQRDGIEHLLRQFRIERRNGLVERHDLRARTALFEIEGRHLLASPGCRGQGDFGLCRLLLEALDRARRTPGLRPYRCAVRRRHNYGGLREVANLYNETCARFGRKSGRLMCSYFTHFCDTKAEEDRAHTR